jgi:hypothetical protein
METKTCLLCHARSGPLDTERSAKGQLAYIRKARGARDGKFFGSPLKEPHSDAKTPVQQIREWQRGFPDKKFCHPAIWGPIRERSPYFVGESTFGTKMLGRDPLESARRPSTNKEMARGCRDGYLFRLRPKATDGRSRRFATECGKLRHYDVLRQITALHGTRRQHERSPTHQ